MNTTIRAVYREGHFVPLQPFELPEGSQVEIRLGGPQILGPKVTEPAERLRILKGVVERMKGNPIPTNAPRLTRDDLHERH